MGLEHRKSFLDYFCAQFASIAEFPILGFLSDKYSVRKFFLGNRFLGIWTILDGLTELRSVACRQSDFRDWFGLFNACYFFHHGGYFCSKIRGECSGIWKGRRPRNYHFHLWVWGNWQPLNWAWGFIILGIASIISGFVILIFVDEPVRGGSEPEMKGQLTFEQAEIIKLSLMICARFKNSDHSSCYFAGFGGIDALGYYGSVLDFVVG